MTRDGDGVFVSVISGSVRTSYYCRLVRAGQVCCGFLELYKHFPRNEAGCGSLEEDNG